MEQWHGQDGGAAMMPHLAGVAPLIVALLVGAVVLLVPARTVERTSPASRPHRRGRGTVHVPVAEVRAVPAVAEQSVRGPARGGERGEGVPGVEARALATEGIQGPRHASEPDAAVARPSASPEQVAPTLALIALAYRSGLPTWEVLEAVSDGVPEGPANDLRQVATALRWGADDAEAWGSVGPAWAPAARAVAVAHLAGVPPGPLLLAASDDAREAELERIDIAAARVGVRLVAPLGLVLLPAFCLTTVVPLVIALAGELLDA